MNKVLFGLAACILSVLYAEEFAPLQTAEEVKNELNFLTSSADQGGCTYEGSIGSLKRLVMPLSYYSTSDYWGSYVGSLPEAHLEVIDLYNEDDYTLRPKLDSPGRELQIERVRIHNGVNIYDGACWQMALGVCAHAGFQSIWGTSLFDVASNQNQLLFAGYNGNAFQMQQGINRAVTLSDGTFSYNGGRITTPRNAYFFRVVPRNWIASDPLMNSSYQDKITAENLPTNPQYEVGGVTWIDWKPITGENAWAFFIGPLQTVYLKQQSLGLKYISFSSTAVQNALSTFFAIRYMQSDPGGMYYACKGSLSVDGEDAINPYEVSIKDSASTLAGLAIFQRILQDELQYEDELNAAQKQQIHGALNAIRVMIFGGDTPQARTTKGLLTFFKNYAWNTEKGLFHHHGDANNPRFGTEWKPRPEQIGVENNTWTVAALGQALIDGWYGFGTCYDIWQNLKEKNGFIGPNRELWGMGHFSKEPAPDAENYSEGIFSFDWTASAINMLRVLISQYEHLYDSALIQYSEADYKQADVYVEAFKKDHDSLCKYLMTLRNDRYPQTQLYDQVRPNNYTKLIPLSSDKLAFIEAHKRGKIPYEGIVNPLPSTAATAWALMLHFNFNPFKIGGNYYAPFFNAE